MSHLVEVATKSDDDRALRGAVSKALRAFDADDKAGTKTAFRTLDKASSSASGRSLQVLLLALGALVEAGASPELAWPIASRGLHDALQGATRFARACIRAAGTDEVDVAIETAGADVAAKKPKDADAFRTLPARCLASVACLTRSRKLRARVTDREALAETAYPLEDVVDEAGFLRQVLLILDEGELTVVHPESKRGFRVTTRDVTTNFELALLLADALVGDEAKGLIPGRRPAARAVAVAKGETKAPKKAPEVTLPFDLHPAKGGDPHGLALDDIPAEIPVISGERVLVLQAPHELHPTEVEAPFGGLEPRVRVIRTLKPAEVEALLAPRSRSASRTPKKAKARAARRTS
ncbi:hypothetical protein AKJ09_09517 [Labilithrix luteola]|uniref:Uncharacterized protein n=1 Tax=Labilithrix luteola TaxID=1391654 RepID=A0A0K1QAT9_9BACT|nr:hypothetical protein [Labilithrix luteola]AKV02854.1 hypothetical protein AKJ09_09517 [Labilithrix luteola]